MTNTIHLPKKTILLLVLVIVLLGVFYFVTQNPSATAQPINPPTNNAAFSPPRSVKVEVETQEAQKLPVNNFYKDPTVTYPSGDTVIEEKEQYQLAFILKDKQFIVTIFPMGTPETQKVAEQALLTKLGITEKTACTLNVEIHSFLNASLRSSPKVSKLSFCNQ